MDHKLNNKSIVSNPMSDSEMPFFDLESQRLDFDNYVFNTSSDTDTSILDCSLDESFQQIKNDLEQLHNSTPKRKNHQTTCDEPSVVIDDESPEIDINERFDIMKDLVQNYRAKETETLRQYIIELNNTIARVTNSEGKLCVLYYYIVFIN